MAELSGYYDVLDSTEGWKVVWNGNGGFGGVGCQSWVSKQDVVSGLIKAGRQVQWKLETGATKARSLERWLGVGPPRLILRSKGVAGIQEYNYKRNQSLYDY